MAQEWNDEEGGSKDRDRQEGIWQMLWIGGTGKGFEEDIHYLEVQSAHINRSSHISETTTTDIETEGDHHWDEEEGTKVKVVVQIQFVKLDTTGKHENDE